MKKKPLTDNDKKLVIVTKKNGEEIECTVEQFVQACSVILRFMKINSNRDV